MRRLLLWWLVWSVLVVPFVAPMPAFAAPMVHAQAVVVGLNDPAMFTIAGDGRIFYAELSTGRIGLFSPASGSNRASDTTYFQVPDLCTQGDQGLFGLALHPSFPTVPTVYAYATRKLPDGSCDNEVLKIDGTAGQGSVMTVLLADPYTRGHIGGRLLFGPDGDLYISTGDGSDRSPSLAQSQASRALVQDVNSFKGKILRMTATGAVPAGNPFGNYVFAYGFRNVFGFDFDPLNGRLWVIDNGPDRGDYVGAPPGPGPLGGCNDELDLVLRSANYGWGPTGSCATPPNAPLNTNQDGPNRRLPKLDIVVSSGVTGGRFCSGCRLGTLMEGRLLYVRFSYNHGMGEIDAAKLNRSRAGIVSDVVVFRPAGASPLSIERGPDGSLYYSDHRAIYKLI